MNYKKVVLLTIVVILFFGVTYYIYNINREKSLKHLEYANIEREEITYNQKEINNLIIGYENAIVEAINNNKFRLVESYIDSNSKFYNMQNKLVTRLSNRKITEKLLGVQIENVKEEGNVLKVYVYEKFSINYGGTITKVKEFNYIYEVKKVDGKLKLSNIETNEKKTDIKDNKESKVSDNFSNETNYELTGKWEYTPTDIIEINKDLNKFIDKKVQISGKIIHIKEGYASMDIIVSDGGSFIHLYFHKKQKLFEGDNITISGNVVKNDFDFKGNKIISIYVDEVNTKSY